MSCQNSSNHVKSPEFDKMFQSDIELISDDIVVVKIGGSTLGGHDTTLKDLVQLKSNGINPVVVHGGAKVVSDWMHLQGIQPKFVRGLRVTDKSSLDIVTAVLSGLVNKSIVASIFKMGGKSVGLSGVDGGMLLSEVSDPELGHVGGVVTVDPLPINMVIDAGFIPVIATVTLEDVNSSLYSEGILNVNADTVAGEIAMALKAKHLVFTTDVDGVMDSSRRLIPRILKNQASGLIRSSVIDGGMLPKIEACIRSLNQVSTAHIINGTKPHTLADLLSGKIMGTRVG